MLNLLLLRKMEEEEIVNLDKERSSSPKETAENLLIQQKGSVVKEDKRAVDIAEEDK